MHSRLTLSTQASDGRTKLKTAFASPPLKLISLPTEDDGVLRVVQMSSSPGLLGQDVIDTDIKIGSHCTLFVYTQAFTRVLQMKESDCAKQHTHIQQAPYSSLCYLPHPLVLHANSALHQTTSIHLCDHCELIYGEIVASGRVLCEESFAFRDFSSQLSIYHQNRKIISDKIKWQPSTHHPDIIGQMEGYTHQLTLFYVNTAHDATKTHALNERIFEHLDEHVSNQSLLWGVSQAGNHALCVKALAHDAQSLQDLTSLITKLLHQSQNSPLSAAFLK